MSPPQLMVYKFLVPGTCWVHLPSNPDVQYRGVMAITMAFSENEARAQIVRYANEFGLDSKWLEVARVVEITPAAGVVLGWAET